MRIILTGKDPSSGRNGRESRALEKGFNSILGDRFLECGISEQSSEEERTKKEKVRNCRRFLDAQQREISRGLQTIHIRRTRSDGKLHSTNRGKCFFSFKHSSLFMGDVGNRRISSSDSNKGSQVSALVTTKM